MESERSNGTACTTVRDGSRCRLRGEIDAVNIDVVLERLLAEVRGGAVDIDLSGVRFCSVAGIRAIVEVGTAIRARGRMMTLYCPTYLVHMIRLLLADDIEGCVVVEAGGPREGGGSAWTTSS